MYPSRFASFCVAGAAACVIVAAPHCFAQSPQGSVPPVGSSLLNPNTSVIGWFQGEAGDRTRQPGAEAFQFKEAEMAFQAAVDPYSRADFILSVNADGIDLEESYLTLLTLPAGLSAKLGKFRSNFGRFNRTHSAETPFADRPLAAERFFGEKGLSGTGASVSWLVPNPLGVYANLDAEVTTTPEASEAPAFDTYRGKDLLYVGRASSFVDLSESSNLAFGLSYANGANGADSTSPGRGPYGLRAQLYGGDVTFRWKNPRRAIYRSLLVRLELMERSAAPLAGPATVSRGAFAYADYQFSRRWHLGARYDWAEDMALVGEHATGGIGFLTFTPSEFSLMSLQASHHELEAGQSETRYFLKTTFNIGPHGAHPF